MMLSAREYILSKQIQWAHNQDLELIGSKGTRGQRFDAIARQILRQDFNITTYPHTRTCRECDLMAFCKPPGLKSLDL